MGTTKKLRAAIYVRQSVREDQGIAQQIAECQRRAKGEGWSVVDIYNDNATSATKERGAGTEWARMLADIDAGRIDLIVSVAVARLLRRVDDVLEVTKPKRDVRVVTVRDGIDTGTTFGKAILVILVALAESEIAEKEDRARPYRAARREAGHPAPGLVPFGYRWVPKLERDDNGTRYAVVQEEADILQHMSAEFRGGATLFEIVQALNAEGVRTRRGAPWRPSTVRRLLISPFQAAMLPPAMPEGAKYSADAFTWSECVPGAWEPILSADEVLASRGILLDPARRSHDGDTRPRHLLSVIGRCGKCHGSLRAATTNTKHPVRGYRCAKGCFQRPADLIDEFVTDAVIGVLSAPGLLHWVDDGGHDIEALRARKDALAATRGEWWQRVKAGTVTPNEWDDLVAEWDAELAKIDADLGDALKADPLAEFVGADDVRGLWDSLSTGRRRAILSALVSSVDVLPVGKGVRVTTLERIEGTVLLQWRRVEHRVSWDTGETRHIGKVPAEAQAAIVAALN